MRGGLVEEAENLFDEMPDRNVVTWNTMINGYFKNGQKEKAFGLLGSIPNPDIYTYNTMISGLVQSGDLFGARKVFDKMDSRDVVTWNSIIAGYVHKGMIDEAMQLFHEMPLGMRGRDTVSWIVMVSGLAKEGRLEEGVKLFMMMKESELSPDKATFTSILTICSELPALCLGEQVCAQSIKTALNHTIEVCNAMITMYARCGNMTSALRCFSSMPTHNVISWNSIISGFSHHGLGPQALEMFEEMRFSDVKPNELTFIAVLSACSHAGLVEKGKYYFDYMKDECFLQPTAGHYTCIVDLFGRFGLIDEAMSFIDQMRADGLEVPVSVWGAILGACRVHRNVEVGAVAAENVLAIEPNRSGTYMILAEIYASVGRLNEVERVLTQMKKNGVKKQPGCSWIEMNDGGSVFLSGDKSHLEFDRIVEPLEVLHVDVELMSVGSDQNLVQSCWHSG
ncbi:unnamed protein product [Linum tenue]|uniref:Pentatricopeptide repeat-containing protein n=1 Tax=Linum tenue TaxID=586396 RepID=A0AAV0L248_9ROSI|nr:unnamed protein product [Linum tenue]